MAKQKKFTLDDFSFDKNLDVPDFDFDLKPPKDTRKPIMKVASGLKSGFSAVALSNDFARDMVKKALPKGFGSAYDITEKSAANLKSLYDDTAREVRPFMNDLKRTTARLLPKVEEVMPKKVAQMVKDWTATADMNPSSPNYDPREAEISAQLAGMVKATALLQQKQSEDNDSKDRLREGLEQVRHRDKLKQLDQMRLGIIQLADYQANVTSNYHRKSLELQYRHYFVAVDALEESKRGNAEMKAMLAAIVHNTALPEQVKLHASDSFKQMAKKQIGSVIGNTIFGRSNDFLNTLMGNLKKTAVGRVKNTIGGLRGTLTDINSGLDDADLAEAMGAKTDPYHTGGMVAGAFGTGILGDWLGSKLKPHLEKIPGIKKAGNRLQYGVENLPQILDQWARSNKGESGGLSDGLVRFLKANVRSASKLQTGVMKDTVQGMNEASYFSRQNSKTLNEIIPGYLARMLRELQIIRTGDQKTEMTHYDFTKNRFDTHSNVKKNAFGALVDKDQREWTKDQVEKLIDEVDGKKTLSPDQRRVLGQQLLRNNVRGRLGGVDVLGKTQRYDGEAQPHAGQFSQLFRDYFKNDHDSSKKHSFANAYNSLGGFASASRNSVQDFSNLGMNDFLQESGILNEKGDAVDLEKFFQYYYGSEYKPGDNPAAPGQHTFTGQPMGAKGPRPRRAARPPKQPFMGGKAPVGGMGDQLSAKLLASIQVSSMHQERLLTTISDMIYDPKSKPSVFSQMLEKLTAMQERMEKGLPTMVVGNVADGSIPAAAADTGKKGKGWWWNRSIKDAAKGVAGGIWGGARKAGQFGNWLVGGGFGAVNGVTRFATGLIGKQVGRAFDKARGFKDVYSEDTGRKVLLYGQRLKAGEYFDAKTGKPIKTWKDIQGAVADETGIVMTEEQAATAYVREGMGKKLIRGMGAIVKTAAKIGNSIGGSVFNALPRGWKLVSGAGGMVLKAASSYMNGPQDVYVHDANNPKKLRKALDSRTMRAGGYKSGVTDHPIKSPKDIDGSVDNYKGVEVLSDDEFKMGLYNKNGDPLKTGVARLLGGVGKIAGAGIGALKWLAGGINQGVGHAFGLGKGFLSGISGIFGRHGIFFGGGKRLMDTVSEIRDLLKDRLPQQKKIRKGSIEDQHKTRKEELDEAWKKHLEDQDGGEKKKGGILGMLSGLFGRKKKKDDEDKDGKGGLVDDVESGLGQAIGGSILGKIPGGKYLRKIPGIGRLFGKGGAKAAAGAAEGAVAGAAKRGLGSRLLGGLKWGKGLGAGLALGAAGSLANATGHTTIGKGLDYAGDATTGWAAASGLAGLLGVQGGALGLAGAAGGALLSGLGALIASPVLLPALGIAATGAALYGGYRFLTRNKLDDLSKVRYAQYGWKADDNDYVSKVFGLESTLMPGVIYQGGMAQIDPKKVDLKKAVESFGVDLKDKDQCNAFATWYLKRFKPVFITHLTVLNGIKPGVSLGDVGSKLNAQEKQKYLSGIQMPADPYSVMISPVPGGKLTAGPDDVKAAIDDAKKSIDKDAKSDKDKKPADALNKASQAASTTVGAAAGAAAVGAAAGAAVDAINKQATGNQPQLPKTGGSGAGSVASVGAGITPMNNAQVGAMEAIRFKTYGLKEMDTDKVHSLRQLEALVQKDVKVSKGKADWNGDASDLTAKIAPQFGFSGNRSNRAYDWMAWFHKRFLPTYLTYVSAVCSVTNQQDPSSAMKAIKPDDLLNAAKQVVSASTSMYGASTSVWQIPASPWESYELNKESASTDGNMASLKQAQKAPALPEQAAFQKKTSAANDSKNASQAGGPAAPPSWLDKIKSTVSNAWDSTKAFAGKAWDSAKSTASAVGTGIVNAGKAVGSAVSDVVSGAGDALKSGYDSAKKTAARGVASVSAALKGGMNVLASLISRGEGNYSIANKPSGNSYPVAKGVDVSKMTIGQIQQAQSQRQLFAVGRYQLIPSTLAGAVKQLGLSADTVFSPALQDKIFSEFLVGSKRPKIAAYLSGKSDDVAGAALSAAQEWASIGTPKGMKNAHGQVSDGTTSYYAGIGGNKASISADEIMGALQAARKDGSAKQTVNVANAPAGGAGAGSPDKSGGATTTAAAAPSGGSTGSAGGGIMKVADQTPGPAPATKGTTPTPADTSASSSGYPAAASDTSGGSTPPVTGFQNRNKDLAAQGDYQNENMAKSLGPVTDVLKQSLTVQQQMLQALQQIAKMGSMGQPSGPGSTPAPSGGSASPDAMQRKNPQSMPTPPVSMSKMV